MKIPFHVNKLGLGLLVILVSTSGGTSAPPSLPLAFDNDHSVPNATLSKMMPNVPNHVVSKSRNLKGTSSSDYVKVMLKNLECSACMKAPAATTTSTVKIEGRELQKLAVDETLVTATICEAEDPYQVWDLISLGSSETWYVFENKKTKSCMRLVGECSSDESHFTIEMGECETSDPKAVWGIAGLGHLVNMDCFGKVSDPVTTPHIFLDAQCDSAIAVDQNMYASHANSATSNFWAILPRKLFAVPGSTTGS